MSNGQINAKIECIKDQIVERRLESIKLLVMIALAGDDIAYWTPEKAKRHGEAMYSLLQAYYSTAADCDLLD